jgi:FMN phosphatase YigB (HAD superfamily)
VRKRVLITDVDNTLLDWQDLWYQTFSAMIAKVIEISGLDQETLYAECSVIHQKYGTSEYSRLLGELPCRGTCGGHRQKIAERNSQS